MRKAGKQESTQAAITRLGLSVVWAKLNSKQLGFGRWRTSIAGRSRLGV
jgi:hypothetical protein